MLSPPLVESKHALKDSVNSVCSVRENTPQRVACVSSHRLGAFSFSQSYTEEQNTQRPTETLSQPISQNVTATEASPPAPLRMERGVITEIPLYVLCMFSNLSPIIRRPIGVTSHTTPLPAGEGLGEGPLSCGFEMCAKKALLNL